LTDHERRFMKLLIFSDLHRDRDAARSLVERAAEADVLVGAGDFAVMRHGIDDVIEILREVDKPTVLVPGNGESDVELREVCAGWASAHVLHGEGVTLEGIPFYGIGGGIPVTPFGEWSFDLTEEDAEAMLVGCPEGGVLVSHSPPHGHVDEAGGRHLGSYAVLETIERVSPSLVVCGHIHGCWGKRSTIGSTLVLNAGPEGQVLELPE
jgi:Icc-related predicted phosphoesterase